MTGPANTPVDVMAILTDLTGVVEAHQRSLGDLSLIVESQDHALRQLLPARPLRSAVPTAPAGPGGA